MNIDNGINNFINIFKTYIYLIKFKIKTMIYLILFIFILFKTLKYKNENIMNI